MDIQDGYLDRLLLTPVRRLAILTGHMVADVAIACVMMVPIVALALAPRRPAGGWTRRRGIVPADGLLVEPGVRRFRLRDRAQDRQPGRGQSSFLLFFAFLFMTSSYVPRGQLSGWLSVLATWNPVTYVLEGLWSWSPSAGSGPPSARPRWRSPRCACWACRCAWPRCAGGPGAGDGPAAFGMYQAASWSLRKGA